MVVFAFFVRGIVCGPMLRPVPMPVPPVAPAPPAWIADLAASDEHAIVKFLLDNPTPVVLEEEAKFHGNIFINATYSGRAVRVLRSWWRIWITEALLNLRSDFLVDWWSAG